MPRRKGAKRKPSYQTAKANATPRLGQKTKSPFQRMQAMQNRQRDSFSQASYDVGRTRRMA